MRNPAIPDNVKYSFKKTEHSNSAEEDLWREVVVRLVLDAWGDTAKDPDGIVREARRWFREDFDDVDQVFSLAGISPTVIVAEVEKLT